VSQESTTPFRGIPDGTDMARVARDDAAWAAYSQAITPFVAPEFAYVDNFLPDHAGKTYRGLEGLRRALVNVAEPFEEMIYTFERIVGSGDLFVSVHRMRARARHTGISFDQPVAYIWHFRDGRIVHAQGFLDPDEALKAAGLEA